MIDVEKLKFNTTCKMLVDIIYICYICNNLKNRTQ